MRKLIIIIFLLCGVATFTYAQSSKYFIKHYFTDSLPQLISGVSDEILEFNNSYYTSGRRIENYGWYVSDFKGFVLKLNEYGDTTKVFVKPYDSTVLYSTFEMTQKGDYIFIIGILQDTLNTFSNGVFIKADTLLNELHTAFIEIDTVLQSYPANRRGFTPSKIHATKDDNFIITGKYTGTPDSLAKAIIIKVDTIGNVLWKKLIVPPEGSLLNDAFTDVIEDNDSNLVFVGNRLYNFQNSDIWMLKTNKNGDIIWSKHHFSPPAMNTTDALGGCLYLENENTILVSGVLSSTYPILFKADTSGNIMYYFTSPRYEDGSLVRGGFRNVSEGQNNSIIAYGNKRPQNPNNSPEAYVVNYDYFGNIIWERGYKGIGLTGTNGFTSGIKTTDGGYIFSGYNSRVIISQGVEKYEAFIVKTNCLGFTGAPQAQMQCNGTGLNYTFTNLSERADTCYLDFGDGNPVQVFRAEHDTLPINHTYAAQGNYQITLIATACGEADTMVCSFNTSTGALYDAEEKLSVFPNPAINQLTIKAAREIQLIKIYNSLGALVYNEIGINANTKMINVETLKSGIYFIEIEGGFGIIKEKFIKL